MITTSLIMSCHDAEYARTTTKRSSDSYASFDESTTSRETGIAVHKLETVSRVSKPLSASTTQTQRCQNAPTRAARPDVAVVFQARLVEDLSRVRACSEAVATNDAAAWASMSFDELQRCARAKGVPERDVNMAIDEEELIEMLSVAR